MLNTKSVKEIINHLKSKDLSIKEVIQFYFDNIDKFNPITNSIVSMKDKNEIFNEAEKKKDSELCGLPIAIKDLSDVVGFPTTYGYSGAKNNKPNKNSFFVDKLLKAGVTVIGKTNTAELGVGGQTINRLFGPTSNAFDYSKCAAGSSGGASTAVALGMLPFADGTDQMGSCRGPAAFANIYGFRPTTGLIASDRSYQHPKIPVLTTPGCFAKTPDDMSLLLDLVVGSNKSDPLSFDISDKFENTTLSDKEFSEIKIVVLNNLISSYDFEKGIVEMFEDKLMNLKNYSKVESINNDIKTNEIWDSWTCFRAKSIYHDTKNMQIQNINHMTEQAIWEYNKGSEIKDDDLKIAYNKKNKILVQIEEIFNKFDFIVLPSSQVFPFNKDIQYPKRINEIELDTYHRWLEVFVIPSLFNLPTLSVPIGFNKNGFPMGMQIIANQGKDLKLLSFAKRYEEIYQYSTVKLKINNEKTSTPF